MHSLIVNEKGRGVIQLDALALDFVRAADIQSAVELNFMREGVQRVHFVLENKVVASVTLNTVLQPAKLDSLMKRLHRANDKARQMSFGFKS